MQGRTACLVLTLLLAGVCALMVPRVNVNTDMTRYLPVDSEMRQGIDRMTEALGAEALNMLSVRAMYHGLDAAGRDSLAARLRQMEGVQGLTSMQENGDYVLYDLAVAPNYDPKAVAAQIRSAGGDVVVETNVDGSLPDPIVVVIAALLVFAILFLMCESWVESMLFLATIGVAVVLNVGSNVLLPSVSMTTNSIVAILQLVLSIDYSIILMNRYRQELATGDAVDRVEAMRRALAKASPSVLSSALTTMAGLLMLCFMKFRIGMDLGIVLAKGVLCSVVCLYMVLPSLVLLFDKAIGRTHKRVLVPNTDGLARFERRLRYPLAVVAVVAFGSSIYLQGLTDITFSTNWSTDISEQFPRKNTVVLLYQNSDEDKIIGLAEALRLDGRVDTVVSYPTLMRRQQTASEMYASLRGLATILDAEAATMIDSMLTPELLEMVYLLRQDGGTDDAARATGVGGIGEIAGIVDVGHPAPLVTVGTSPVTGGVVSVVPVAQTVAHDMATETDVQEDAEVVTAVPTTLPTYRDTILTPMDAATLSAYLGFDARQAATLYRMAGRAKGRMSPYEFVRYVCEKVLTNKMYASFVDSDQKRQLAALRQRMEEALSAPVVQATAVADSVGDTLGVADTLLTQDTMARTDTLLAAGEVTCVVQQEEQALPDVSVSVADIDDRRVDTATCSLEELVTFITEDLVNDPVFADFIDDTMRSHLGGVRSMMDEGVGRLKGNGWSMAAIVTSYDDEGEEVQQFLQRLRAVCDATLEGEYSLIGESVMFDEMRRGFGRELLLLTVLTILAISLIVALTFRSLVVAVMLVLTVLTGVYVDVFISGLGGRTLLYMAYLIVQSILMGATIDYAILFTNYYREQRRSQSVEESIKAAYSGSIRTILTSGLIVVLAPGIMSLLVEDRTVSAIVGSLAVGGFVAIMLILFVLPGCLAAFDRYVTRGVKKGEDKEIG